MQIRLLENATIITTSTLALLGAQKSINPLDKTNTNLIANGDGPLLYYNGTGKVPSYHEITDPPEPITPIKDKSILIDAFYREIIGIVDGAGFGDDCSKCVATVEVLHFAALTQPVLSFEQLLIRMCHNIPLLRADQYLGVSCEASIGSKKDKSHPFSSGAGSQGAFYAQLFSKMSIHTGDMNLFCHERYKLCPAPPAIGISEDLYFPPKPASAHVAPTPSNKTYEVLHLSDWHLDPRYDIGSEGNCTQHLCCRPYSTNKDLETNRDNASLPASRFGSFSCDTPADLALSSFIGMRQFFNTSDLAFAIFTGDIISHDNMDQLSQAYVEYEEKATYATFKAALGDSTPLYATLGNHDTLPHDFAPNSQLYDEHKTTKHNALSWNYNLVSSLWHSYSWLDKHASNTARTHYGAYAYTDPNTNLRIISLNTDFWYQGNIFNYANSSNPDPSGLLHWLSTELISCEKHSQRAWILGHIPSGYTGNDALPHHSALFYSIVVRFSPATIAGIFFGHTHQDQVFIYYDFLPNSTYEDPITGLTLRNASMVDYNAPVALAHIGPSITPLQGLNSGFQVYSIDKETGVVHEKKNYFANMSESLEWEYGPEWKLEYDTRSVYAGSIGWDDKWPLNATFWHLVTEEMLRNSTLVQLYSLYETKSSVRTPECKSEECIRRKVCYMRSGNSYLGRACK